MTVLASVPKNSSAETVNVTLSPSTSQVLGAWNYSTVACNFSNTPACVYGQPQVSDYFAWKTINDVCTHLSPGTIFDGAFFCEFGNVVYIYLGNQASTKTAYVCTTPPDATLNSANQCVSCPAVAVGEKPFKLDPSGATCSRPDAATCPIDPLPDLPKGDLCTASLEKGAGKDIDKVCPALDPEMVKQEQCLADKIHRLGLSAPYTEPSATIRTVAYQQHFVDIWKWHTDIVNQQKFWTDAQKQKCAPIKAKVEAELAAHGIDAPPSNKGDKAPHVLGKALDIPRGVRDALMAKVDNSTYITPIPPFCLFCKLVPVPIGDVQDYVSSALVNPPGCNLRWGGRFTPYDPVHFQLP